MNISKILLASFMFPIVYPRAVLNAVTLPMLMLVCNWALGANWGSKYAFLSWFSYVFQFYAVSVLLTNCISLVTKNEVPNFLEKQFVYAKCSLLLACYTFAVFGVKYCFVMLGLDIFNIAVPSEFTQLDEIAQFTSSVILFSIFFVIPHYIYTGEVVVKEVFRQSRKYIVGLTLIVFIIEIFKTTIGYMFVGATNTPIILLGSMALLMLQAFGYIIISFCYIAIFSKKTQSIIDV
ncbi:hypothetical protein [Psychromonas antarctica]|uniref:hypothetical protein n=1 Tax=Psychromonas antarctica TaxID=67573 RepID=UPI001EE804D8|nr:hypothetical protein [Psychromonas antarctica]MCG6201975.1 hypothetical protein [Psychromonas antarctica]